MCQDKNCIGGCAQDCPVYRQKCPVVGDRECSGHGTCNPFTGECVCSVGYAGNSCDACKLGFIKLVSGGPCVFIPGSATTCSDGVKNGNELGVDCGGANCAPCPASSLRGRQLLKFLLTIVAPAVVGVSVLAVAAVLLTRSKVCRGNKVTGSNLVVVSRRNVAVTKRVVPVHGDDTSAARVSSLVVDWAAHEKQ